MLVYKKDFEQLKTLVMMKPFSVPNFRLLIEDGLMKVNAICEQQSLAFNYEQKIGFDGDVDVVLSTPEFIRMFSVFAQNFQIDVEFDENEMLVSSKEKDIVFNCRYTDWTTEPPTLKLVDDADDVFMIEFADLKRAVSDLTLMNADRTVWKTDGSQLVTETRNVYSSLLKKKIAVQGATKGQTVTLDASIVAVTTGLISSLPVELRLSSVQPIRLRQADEERKLEIIFVPLLEDV